MKYLKSLKPFSVVLFTGKETDTTPVTFIPGELKPYYDLVVEDAFDVDYNDPIYKDYIARNILTIIDIREVIISSVKFIFIQNSGNLV